MKNQIQNLIEKSVINQRSLRESPLREFLRQNGISNLNQQGINCDNLQIQIVRSIKIFLNFQNVNQERLGRAENSTIQREIEIMFELKNLNQQIIEQELSWIGRPPHPRQALEQEGQASSRHDSPNESVTLCTEKKKIKSRLIRKIASLNNKIKNSFDLKQLSQQFLLKRDLQYFAQLIKNLKKYLAQEFEYFYELQEQDLVQKESKCFLSIYFRELQRISETFTRDSNYDAQIQNFINYQIVNTQEKLKREGLKEIYNRKLGTLQKKLDKINQIDIPGLLELENELLWNTNQNFQVQQLSPDQYFPLKDISFGFFQEVFHNFSEDKTQQQLLDQLIAGFCAYQNKRGGTKFQLLEYIEN